jgi:hypothetical protein
VNLLGDDINTINNNAETLIHASKEADLAINIEKAKFMLVHHHNAGQSQSKNITNR